MRSHARIWLTALLTGVLIAGVPAAAQAAEALGIEKFAAVNCSATHEQCAHEVKTITTFEAFNYSVTKEPSKGEAETEGFAKAGGHPNYGITDFKVATVGSLPAQVPTAVVKFIRTEVAPGLATNPQAVPACSALDFGNAEVPGLFPAPKCTAATELGVNQVTAYAGAAGDIAVEGKVYNLEPSLKHSSSFGVALKLPIVVTKGSLEKAFAEEGHKVGEPTEKALEEKQYYAHTMIEGNVEWGKEASGTNQADYHDYFEIEVSTALPLISSRLVFYGNKGGDFITNATSCPGHNTTTLKLTDVENTTVEKAYTTPVSLLECENVLFEPGFKLAQSTTASDKPDGITTELISPHHTGAGEIDYSQVKTATVTLPAGLTLNPSAAAGLEACTPEQIGIGTKNPIECPERSKIGTVILNVPGLPPESLQGNIYLGGPASGPITGSPYVIYVAAESKRYGVIVRLKGVTTASATGQLTTTFTENPEQPFNSLILHFNGGSLAPLANLVSCETSTATTLFTAFSGAGAKSPTAPFEITGCGSSVPFSPTQSNGAEPAQGGGSSTYSLSFTRPEGSQYLAKVRDVLPPGLVGLIPTVTQCAEPAASAGTCSSASQIGTATVAAGSGAPYTFNGRVYLTGPYEGAPFGLSIVVPNVAGPFDLGNTIARAKIEVDQHTARVIATDNNVPMIVAGIPIRLRSLNISINRQGFERNPTNCSVFNTESTLTGSLGTAVNVSTPFQAEGCSGLGFKPTFKAVVSAKTSKNNGASLETTINQVPGQANIKSVLVQLPKTLPSRLTTLQKACPEAVFAANPYSCPAGSLVGSARANTPTLPAKMQGPAYLVSHGGAAFPDLDLVLEANGVRVIVVGNTDIKNGITTTNFATAPDVPVSAITVSLPTGPHSALAAFGDVCANPLYMPTTITGQNGTVFKQKTRIAVTGCGVKIVGKRVIGNTAYLTIRTFAAGRITGSGPNVSTVGRNLGSAQSGTSLKISLSGNGRSRRKPLRVRLRVGFKPKSRSVGSSVAYTTVTYR
jgi:hypothetical protein